ncbi:carboxypeptidase C (cathepsin A) [Brevibacterium sanguinis]|uniref:Carboxypeptidase C (Cathepsin A) n=2 Tax=Brevibacterium TaxID=1696 RepID=A0A366IHX3_9MICO|nr:MULTISPECIES: peptidase S10 [Brevibacterium]RBP63600.1 carboxypeptidase C (cathepsin A) [Brevibacterium sanguinis]RBP70259.1 carboxypeptidase C (cathepsin A) [Brevibacterium celere]
MTEAQTTAQPQETPTTARQRREPKDDFVTTEHELLIGDDVLRYRAETGRMVIGEEMLEDGVFEGLRPKAQVFMTSYMAIEKPGADIRPVIFVFNGGPGSSSAWLHIGLFGPRRVVANDIDDRTPPPYGLTDNLETSLAYADLVFIDPVTTGFSRTVEGEKPEEFHGFTGDRDIVGEAIRQWLCRNNRWLAPKFLAGESYGTTRAAALAGHLARRHGIAFNGIILISAVLDFGTIDFNEGNEAPYLHYLPTFAAVAHYHGKHPGRGLEDVVAEATEFAYGDYSRALERGSRLGAEDRNRIGSRLSGLIGLDEEFVRLADLRIDEFTFFTQLLRNRGLRIGRLDSRFTAHPGKTNGEVLGDDPSYPIIQYPYTVGINHLLRAELGYESDLTYEVLTSRVHPWSYKEFENSSVNTADDLAFAMRMNPDLKVYVAFGYHDSATPFAASEHVLAHLRISPAGQENIVRRYYPAGHMMYVNQKVRIDQLADIAAFVHWGMQSAPRPESNQPKAGVQ